MQEEFGLGWEIVIYDIVQQGDVDTAGSHVSHNQHHGPPVHKLPNVDLPSRVVEGTVNVGTLYAFRGEQLGRGNILFYMTGNTIGGENTNLQNTHHEYCTYSTHFLNSKQYGTKTLEKSKEKLPVSPP